MEQQVQNAVAVLPAYARGVAAELREAAEARFPDAEPPDADAAHGPRQGAARATPPPRDAAAVSAVLCKALQVCQP